MLVDPALSGLPAFLYRPARLNSGFMIPQVTAAALVSENKQRAAIPGSVDSIPTSAAHADHVTRAAEMARAGCSAWRAGPPTWYGIKHGASAQLAGVRTSNAADLAILQSEHRWSFRHAACCVRENSHAGRRLPD